MASLWLPITEKTTGRKMTIIMPGDPSAYESPAQMEELKQRAIERTQEQLKAMGPKPIARFPRAEVGKALKEYREAIIKRRASPNNRIYY
jgi:hypothetical protein